MPTVPTPDADELARWVREGLVAADQLAGLTRRPSRGVPEGRPRPVATGRPVALALTLLVPVALRGGMNARGSWAVRHRRDGRERAAFRRCLEAAAGAAPPPGLRPPLVVTLAKVGGPRGDCDNWESACKGVRDELAAWLGVDDGDPRVDWRYAREPGGRAMAGVRVTVSTEGG